jgi:ABC-2 type transport system ATP-binding protein
MLNIKQLSFSYADYPILDRLDLRVRTGSIHGILGVNGAGKTTLFKCLYGLLSPQSGVIEWQEEPLNYRHIAFLETGNYFYSYISGREYLQLCAAGHPSFSIEDWNRIFRLPLDQLVDTYSTGMKKQLAFLGILAQDRPLLILDEPFNGLDLESSEKLSIIIQELQKKGKTILIASHILETLTRNCDRISHLSEGEIRTTYEAAEFRAMTDQLRRQLRDDIADDLHRVL